MKKFYRLFTAAACAALLFCAATINATAQQASEPVHYNSVGLKNPVFKCKEKDASDFTKWTQKYAGYPYEEESAKTAGVVLVKFVVTKDGQTRDAKVIQSSGIDRFDESAVKAVLESPKWVPGKLNGQNVDVSMMVPVVFDPENIYTHIMMIMGPLKPIE